MFIAKLNTSPPMIGAMLVVTSALVFSTAGLFTKGVASGAWEIIFWRGVFAAGFTLIYITWRDGFQHEIRAMGGAGLAVAIVGASGTAAFIPALKLTTMANVTLIYASAPLLAVLLAWLCLRERPRARVLAGSFVAIAGVGIIIQGATNLAGRATAMSGDLLALWMTLAMTGVMVIYRRFPGTPAAGPAALSSLFLLPPALLLGEPFAVPLDELAIMAGFGLIFAIASVTLAEGAKRMPAGETALLSALETPLAPLLGWLVFAEIPANTTLIGGCLILVAVIATKFSF